MRQSKAIRQSCYRYRFKMSIVKKTQAKAMKNVCVQSCNHGANGGILGNDAKVIVRRKRSINVTRINNHELSSLPMIDATVKTLTDRGPAMLIFRSME